jgi:hypothetical protein
VSLEEVTEHPELGMDIVKLADPTTARGRAVGLAFGAMKLPADRRRHGHSEHFATLPEHRHASENST